MISNSIAKDWSIRDEHIRARTEEDPPEKIFYLDSGVELEIESDDFFKSDLPS